MHGEGELGSVLVAYQQQLQPRFKRASAAAKSTETEILAGFSTLLTRQAANCFQSDFFTPGHCTGSALVVDPSFSRVVLTYHRKIGRWLQLGGHADGHPLIHEVALREAQEESGMREFCFWPLAHHEASPATPLPFDWDIHQIPAGAGEPAHCHFDVRYLLVARGDLTLQISAESLDLRWFSLAELAGLDLDQSVCRLIIKLNEIRGWLGERLL